MKTNPFKPNSPINPVSKIKIKSKFKGKDSTLDNAPKALRDRHIIFSKEGEKGLCRLQHKGFAPWIKLYADTGLWQTSQEAKQQELENRSNE